MTTMRDDFEALMPEPTDYVIRDRGVDVLYPPCNYAKQNGSPIYTADQMREAVRAATERAAEEATLLATDAAIKYANGHPVDFSKEVGDAIRGTK